MSREVPAGPAQTGTRVMRGASLSVIGNVGTHLLAVLAVAVLGRLLEPSDFGIMTMAVVIAGVFEAMVNRQFDLALIRTKDAQDSHFNTAFGMAILWGLTAASVLFFGSDYIGAYMEEPALADVLKVMALVPLMDSLRNPYFVNFERQLIFWPIVSQHVVSKIAQAGVGVALALWLGNYWALILGFWALSFARLVPTWVLAKSRPRPALTHWRYFLRFGGWLSGTGIVGFIMLRADAAIVFSKLGTAATGLYNMGIELAQMATHHLAASIGQMVYPGLAGFAQDREKLNGAFFRAQEMLLGIMLPLGVGVALIAPEAIRVFVGEKWLPAVPVLQVMGPLLALSCVNYNVQSLLMIEGDTRAMFIRNLIVAVVQVPLILGLMALYGFAGAIMARGLAIVLHMFLSLQIAGRLTGAPWWASLTAARRPLMACLAMALAVLILGMVTGPAVGLLPALWIGALKAAVGAAVFVSTMAALWAGAGRPDGLETRAWGFGMGLVRRVFG